MVESNHATVTVGSLPQHACCSPAPPGRHEQSAVGNTSHKKQPSSKGLSSKEDKHQHQRRDLLPKKERILRGRCRDKERIAKLKAQLADRDLSSARSDSMVRPILLDQEAAIRAATSAAMASAVRQYSSLEQAECISTDVRQALLDLAPFDLAQLSAVEHVDSSSDHSWGSRDVPYLDTSAKAANSSTSVQAQPLIFNLFADEPVDADGHDGNVASGSSCKGDSADAAAGAKTRSQAVELSFQPLASQACGPEDVLPGQVDFYYNDSKKNGTSYSEAGFEQNNSDVGFDVVSHTGEVGDSDEQRVDDAALLGGPVSASDVLQSCVMPLHHTPSEHRCVESSGDLDQATCYPGAVGGDSSTQHCDVHGGPAYYDDTLGCVSEIGGQAELDSSGGHAVESEAPCPFDYGGHAVESEAPCEISQGVRISADTTASRDESARQLENGSEEHGENTTQGGPAQQQRSANGMLDKDIDSRLPYAVAFVKRTAPHGLPPAVMEKLLVHIARVADSEFYSSAAGNVNVQHELLQYNMEFFLHDAGFTAS